MSPTFDDLSQGMSADEKKNLLGRIQLSLNLSSRDSDNIVSKADDAEDLKHRLTKEVEKLGVVDRFFLKLAAFFLTRSESELMAARRLAGSRTLLSEKIPDLVSFSHQEWSPEFGKVIYDLFSEASGLKPVFEHLFHQKLTLEAGLLFLFREEHPAAVRDLEELFSEREMTSVYRKDQKRSSLQGALDQKLNSYFDSIPLDVFERVKDRLRPLYYLRPLVLFPYSPLLENFGHNPDKSEVAKYPFLIGAPWLKTAGLLQRLYYGIYLATKVDWKEGSLNQIFQGVVDHLSDEKRTLTIETLNQRIGAFVRLAQETAQRIPWKDVLQWSFQDPYYTVKFVLPKFSVRDFYQTTIVLNFQEELAARIPPMRQRLLTEERAGLFENGSFHPLEFYISGTGSALGSSKVRGFQHAETLSLLWAFLNHHFPKKIQTFHQSLLRLVSPTSKSSLQGVGNVIEELSALKTRIHQFDRSLHPDSAEGKDFQKLKYESSSRVTGLKTFVQLVQNKDDQALELINIGIEDVQGLVVQLSGIRDKNIPALKSVLGLPYLLEGKQETIENGLDRLLTILQKIVFVLKEAINLES